MTIHDLAEYEILDEHRVEDVQSDGFILRHKKSGARIAVLSNNDDNKVFYIGFRTPPERATLSCPTSVCPTTTVLCCSSGCAIAAWTRRSSS